MAKSARKTARTALSARRAKPGVAYRHAVVSFIDILGFSPVATDGDATEVKKLIDRFYDFGSSPDPDPDDDDYPRTFSFAFSDNIVRIRPLDGPDGDSPLYEEIYQLALAQAELANKRVLIRGGLTVGEIYFEESQVFGPALVSAYHLESRHALYPRIIIDPQAFVALRSNPRLLGDGNEIADEVQAIRANIARGDDAFWHIDYAKAGVRDSDGPEATDRFMTTHRDLILDGLRQAKDVGLRTKYLWLAGYHNRTVEKRLPERTELLIGEDASPALDPFADKSRTTLDEDAEYAALASAMAEDRQDRRKSKKTKRKKK